MSNASNLSTLANVLDDGSDGQFLKSTGSGGVAFDTVAAGAVVYATADLLPLSGFAAGDMAYVTATNRFYINNGSGWYSVSLVNTNPNITSVADAGSNTTPFTLATDQTATVITITAADPEEVPLTYGYSVTSGSLNGSTVAQGTGSNTNVFTVTPHASQDATFTLTFTASDGINQATSANAFSLSFVTVVTDSNHTTLLATATGTSDNNNITDSSSNNHSITVNGDAHAGTFSPYRSGGYSSYGHFRPETVSNTLDTYSLSFWYKLNSVVNDGYLFETQIGSFSMKSETDSGGRFEVGGAAYFQNDGSGNNYLDSNWHYFVVSRTSSATSWYIDGSQINTTSGGSVGVNLGSLSAQGVRNMTFGGRDATSDLGGLATTNRADVEFRDIELKSTTHDGSVPTEPVTSSSDTVFLTAHKPNSLYEYGSTPTSALIGTVGTNFKTIATSPYDYEEYSATDHGGSVYFDGSGDTIGTYHASNLQLGASSAFTLEFWFYANGASSDYQSLFSTYSGSSVTDAGQSARLIFNTSNNLFILTDGSSNFLQITKDVPQNVWNHFCWTRDASNNHKFYLNGEQIGTSTTNTNFQTDWWYFAQRKYNGDQEFTGYISDISLIKGSVTRSSAFTPPTTPLSSSGAALHIKGTDASIIDKSQGTNLLIDGTTITGVSTGSKYSKAIKNTAASSAIKVCTPSEFNMRTNDDFTIEFWFKVDPTSSYSATNYPKYILQIQYGGIVFGIWANPSTTKIEGNGARTDGSSYITWSSSMFTSYTPNQWHHYALSFDKSNTTAKWFLDGSVYHTDTSYNDPSTSVTNSNSTYMVSLFGETGTVNSNTTFIGSIEDFRFSQFTRYTANFTPPSASLEG